jgi:hypothetical protein
MVFQLKNLTDMKRELQKLSWALACMLGLGLNTSLAQDTKTDNHIITIDIPEVALLDLESSGSKDFTMAFLAPSEAGSPVTAPSNNTSVWLNYSSIVTSTGPDATRKVTVKLNATIPGVTIQVTAGTETGLGAGTTGTPASAVTLSASDQDLITGIGSCWTDTGANKGHQLTYAVSLTDGSYSSLVNRSTPVTITYTLSDNS